MSFTHFPLHEQLQRAITQLGYETPTPIQAAALPLTLAGHDLVGTAQTGTGKTAAFVLPILQRLLNEPGQRARRTRALILAPTRELAEQIDAVVQQLAQYTGIRSATIYGGVGMAPQERALRQGVEIIVACPGRLLDLVSRGLTDFRDVCCLVLDEADRMLDMGFLPPITRIIGLLPTERQTLLFSATFAKELQSFVTQNLRNPQRVEMGIAAPAESIAHTLYPVPQHLKTELLTEVLRRTETDSVLVFTRTKHRANRIAQHLTRTGFDAGVLHANKSQNHRQQTLDAFRSGTLRLLVATDIAARGIDVSTISHVVNYDIPDCADTYIHRIGRTGRMARSGEAITFVTRDDAPTILDIERTLKERIPTRTLDRFDYSRPAPKRDEEFKRDPRPPRKQAALKKDSPTLDAPINHRSAQRSGRPPRQAHSTDESYASAGTTVSTAKPPRQQSRNRNPINSSTSQPAKPYTGRRTAVPSTTGRVASTQSSTGNRQSSRAPRREQ